MNTRASNESDKFPGYGSITPELYEIIQFRGRSEGHPFSCVHGKTASAVEEESFRNKVAKEQEKTGMKNKEELITEVVRLTEEFLSMLGIPINYYNNTAKLDLEKCDVRYRKRVIPYIEIKDNCNLNNINHIVWMKFAKEKGKENDKRYLGVVAASNDINFSTGNNSGIIIDNLGLEWDQSFVLIFPLPGITDGMRKDIEVGIGNYLTKNGVSILDLYSHRFQ